MKNLNLKYKLNSWIVSLVIIAAVVLVNIIITNLTNKLPLKIDLTSGKQFEITQETRDVMSKLNQNVKLSVLATEDGVSPVIKEYIEKYKNMSGNLNVEFVDVYKNQAVLNTYKAKGETLAEGDLLFESNGRYKAVASAGLYSENYSMDKSEEKYGFELESKMTNAIATVGGMVEESAIYFIQGHGEQESTALPGSLTTQGYKNSTASISNQDIPADAKLLISFVPTGDFTQDECDKIDSFLDKGGNFLVVYTPGTPRLERLEKYLGEWGITPQQDLVLEKDPSMVGQNEIMSYPEMVDHDITKNLISEKLPLLFYGSVSFDVNENNTQRAAAKAIARTSEKAIGKINLQSSVTDYEQGDLKGPLNLAVVAEKTTPKTARVMVIGSAYAVELPEQYTGSKANSQFVSNSISWLTNNQTGIKIAAKVVTQGKITSLTKANILIMQYLLVWVVPIIILVIGIVIWLRRRYL